ncbi:hypothetical protein [Blastomonas sp.]|uniref:hypothetical protein n=1 Tax=Blastomonas sp. TaxID=1909299 RepID=UPI003593F8C0
MIASILIRKKILLHPIDVDGTTGADANAKSDHPLGELGPVNHDNALLQPA